MSATLCGQLAEWPSKSAMAKILRNAGLRVRVGNYSIRVEDCSHCVIQEYGGDLGNPQIDADADSVEEMTKDGSLVSKALTAAGIKHSFEIYDQADVLAGYLHHDWPSKE